MQKAPGSGERRGLSESWCPGTESNGRLQAGANAGFLAFPLVVYSRL